MMAGLGFKFRRVGLRRGPANENTQTLLYTTVNPNSALFASPPTISPAGVLTFKPKPGIAGTVTLAVTLKDSGGTLNGGVNAYGPLPLTLCVEP